MTTPCWTGRRGPRLPQCFGPCFFPGKRILVARTDVASLCLRFVGEAMDLQGIYSIVNNFLPLRLTISILILLSLALPHAKVGLR